MIERMEAQRQADVQTEQERADRTMDSGIDIPTSSMPFPSPRPHLPSGTVSFDQGFQADPFTAAEREEFRIQQSQRHEQGSRFKAQKQQDGQDVWALEVCLDRWVGKCPLCYIRVCEDPLVDVRHPFDECQDEQYELVAKEVEVSKGIHFERFASCHDCGVAQQIVYNVGRGSGGESEVYPDQRGGLSIEYFTWEAFPI